MTILQSNFQIGSIALSSVVTVGVQSNLSVQARPVVSNLTMQAGVQSNLSVTGPQIVASPVLNAPEVEREGAASAREQAAIARTAANEARAFAEAANDAQEAVTPLAAAAAEDAADAAAAAGAAAAARDAAADLAAGIDADARAAAAAAAAAALVEKNVLGLAELAGAAADSAAAAALAAAGHKGAAEAAIAGAAAQADRAAQSAQEAAASAEGIQTAQDASEAAQAASEAASAASVAARDRSEAAQVASEGARTAAQAARDQAQASAITADESEVAALAARNDARAARDASEEAYDLSDAARAASVAAQGRSEAAQAAAVAARDDANAQAAAAAGFAAAADGTRAAVFAARDESTNQAKASTASAAAAYESAAVAQAAKDDATRTAEAAAASGAAAAGAAGAAVTARNAAQAAQVAAEGATQAATAARAAAEAARDDASVEADAAAAAAANADTSEAAAIAARDDARTARNASEAAQVAATAARDNAAAQAVTATAAAAAAAASHDAAHGYSITARDHAESQAGAVIASSASAAAAAASAAAALADRSTAQEQAAAAVQAAAAAADRKAGAIAASDAATAQAEAAAVSAAAALAASNRADASDTAASDARDAAQASAAAADASAAAALDARDTAQFEASSAVASAAAASQDAGGASASATDAAESAAAAAASKAAAAGSATAAAGSATAANASKVAAATSASAAAASEAAADTSADAASASASSAATSATSAGSARDAAQGHAATAQAAADRAVANNGESQLLSGRNAADGYAGLTGYALNLKNALGSILSLLTNANTAARTYTLPDRDMTFAGKDETDALNTAVGLRMLASTRDANSGVAGLDTSYRLRLKNAAGTFVSFLTNTNTAARTYTLPNKDGTVAMTSDITGTNSNTNTGDETQATIKTKLGKATAAVAGYLDSVDFARFEAKQVALGFVPIDAAQIGIANGIAPLGADSKIAAVYLPSYVDDILEYANTAAFPATGEGGKIYIATDTNPATQWRWSGSAYQQLTSSPGSTDAVPEGAANLYFTTARVLATVAAGLSTATNAAITAADTILAALGKLQAQVTARAMKGANSDITSITGLTTALTVAQGGTGLKTLTGLAFGNGAAAMSAATAAQIATALGTQAISGKAASADAAPWSGITGKPDLVAMVPGTIITNQDWNTLTTPGVYQVSNFTGANGPFTYKWGTLIVTNVNGVITQQYIAHQGEQSSRIYYSSWWAWRGVLDNLNHTAYRPTTIAGLGLTDFKRDTIADNAGVKDFYQPGFYRLNANTGENKPNWGYGNMLVVNGGGDTYGQLYVDYASGQMAVRGGVVGQSGTPWRVIPDSVGTNASGTWNINVWGRAGNTSSCTDAVWVSHWWQTQQQFFTKRSGYGVTSGGGHGAASIQVYSDDGGPAMMTFLRAGSYGVNFGLDSDHYLRMGGWSAGAMFSFGCTNGDFYAAGNVAAYSDERLKKNWRPVGRDFVEQMAGVKAGTYTRKDTGEHQAGLSAQDVRAILPYAVTVENNAMGTLSLAYGNFAGVGVVHLSRRAVAHGKKINRHARRIKALESEVSELKELVKQLISKEQA